MKKAFTLAEVLITLGIIGIVAAMTMPQLLPKLEKIKTEAKLKKFYSVIGQSTNTILVENGGWSGLDYSLTASVFFDKYYSKYIPVLKKKMIL